MNPEGVERVIVTEPSFHACAEEPRNQSRGYSDDNRSRGIDEPGSGSHHDQTCNRPRAEAENARLPLVEIFRHRPDERGHTGRQSGRHEGIRSHAVRCHGRSCVKSVPADPEHSRADHTKHHAVRGHLLFAEAQAFAEDHTENQS